MCDSEKFNKIVEEISISAPITEEEVRLIVPADSRVSIEKAAAIVVMSSMGMMPVAIGDMLAQYGRAEAHIRKRLGDGFE